MSTKARFLEALRSEIVNRHPWASDATRLDRFMHSTRQTLEGQKNLVTLDGEAFKAAWRVLGMSGRPTYKALRALPDGVISC